MIHELLINTPATAKTIPIYLYDNFVDCNLTPFEQSWVYQQQSSLIVIPDEQDNHHIGKILVAYDKQEPMFTLGDFYTKAPKGIYYIANSDLSMEDHYNLLLGFALGAYQYNEFKKHPAVQVQLLFPKEIERQKLLNEIEAHYITRTLINKPPNHLNPESFSLYIQNLFSPLNCDINIIKDLDLLEQNFPLIYHVGKGSEYSPRLIEITYGDPSDIPLTLIGKGVTFDSGGLDIKPSNAMRLMKKDMGGAAHALALTQWIIKNKWPVHLKTLIPIVENCVSDKAMRPGDIIQARNGMTVEVDNTDAEGRLILADAISYATEHSPTHIINFATLTGAARVALGPEIPALFSNNELLSHSLIKKGQEKCDLIWQMPLHLAYNDWIDSDIASVMNSSTQPYGGAITAALFLNRFLMNEVSMAHLDVMAWNVRNRKGRPVGGEAMGLRATYYGLKQYLKITL